MTEPEKQHIIAALQFELSKVTVVAIQQRMLGLLANIDTRLVREVAATLGLPTPKGSPNTGIGTSPALSQLTTAPKTAKTLRVGVLVGKGVAAADVAAVERALTSAGAHFDVIGPHLGDSQASGGKVTATVTYANSASVQYDALFLPRGAAAALAANGDALHFVEEAYKHYKAIGVAGDGQKTVRAALGNVLTQPGVVTAATGAALAPGFVTALAAHRHWNRTGTGRVSA